MADNDKSEGKTVKLAPRSIFVGAYEPNMKGVPDQIKGVRKGGTDVPEDKVEKLMEQAEKDGYPLQKL